MKILIAGLLVAAAGLALVWFTDLGGLKSRLFVNQIVKMRVSPARLENVKTPSDYGMPYKNVDIITADGVRLSAWDIPAPFPSDKTIIVNHALGTTRYGAVDGLDGVPVEYLPMLKHLHDNGYNIVTYDHRGQGDSDGGVGKTQKGAEAPVSVGVTEWQDIIASYDHVKSHPDYSDDQIAFISQCMGANATFLAWRREERLSADPSIRALVAIQPPVSYRMNKRFIKIKTGMDLVDQVLERQKALYGFGFADPVSDIAGLSVPVLFSQVEADVYTFNEASGVNDIEVIFEAAPTEKELILIGPDKPNPHGTGKRFDGYGYYNRYPEELLEFLAGHFE